MTSSFDSVSGGNLTLQALRQVLQGATTYSGVPAQEAAAQSALANQVTQVELQTAASGDSAGSTDSGRGHLVNISS
jgi:hypothetical protein